MNDPTFIDELQTPGLGPRLMKIAPAVNLMEEIDVLVLQGVLSERAVMMNFASNIVQLWELREPGIRMRRKLYPDAAVHFEDLAARASRWNATEQRKLQARMLKMPDSTKQ